MRLLITLLIVLAVFVAVQVHAAPGGGDPYLPRQQHVSGVAQHSSHN